MKKSDLIESVDKQLKKIEELEQNYLRYVEVGLLEKNSVNLQRLNQYKEALSRYQKALSSLPESSPPKSSESDQDVQIRAEFRRAQMQISGINREIDRLLGPIIQLSKATFNTGTVEQDRFLFKQHLFNSYVAAIQEQIKKEKLPGFLTDTELNIAKEKLVKHISSFDGLITSLNTHLKSDKKSLNEKQQAYESATEALDLYKQQLNDLQDVVYKRGNQLQIAEESYQLTLERKNVTVQNALELLQRSRGADIKKYLGLHADPTIKNIKDQLKDQLAATEHKQYLSKNEKNSFNNLEVLQQATNQCRQDADLLTTMVVTLESKIKAIELQVHQEKEALRSNIEKQIQNFNYFYGETIGNINGLEEQFKTSVIPKVGLEQLKEQFDTVIASPVVPPSGLEDKLRELNELNLGLSMRVKKHNDGMRQFLNDKIADLESPRRRAINELALEEYPLDDLDDRRVATLLHRVKVYEHDNTEPTLQGLRAKYAVLQESAKDFKENLHELQIVKAAYEEAKELVRQPRNLVNKLNDYDNGSLLLRALARYVGTGNLLKILENSLGSFNEQSIGHIKTYMGTRFMSEAEPLERKITFIEVLNRLKIDYKPLLTNDRLIAAVVHCEALGLSALITKENLYNPSFLNAIRILDALKIEPEQYLETLLKDANKCDIICQQHELNNLKEQAKTQIKMTIDAATRQVKYTYQHAMRELENAMLKSEELKSQMKSLIEKEKDARLQLNHAKKAGVNTDQAEELVEKIQDEIVERMKLWNYVNQKSKDQAEIRDVARSDANSILIEGTESLINTSHSLKPLSTSQFKVLMLDFLQADPEASQAVNTIRQKIGAQPESNGIDNGLLTINNACNPALLILFKERKDLQMLVNNQHYGTDNIVFLNSIFQEAASKLPTAFKDDRLDAVEVLKLLDNEKNKAAIAVLQTANDNPEQCQFAKVTLVMKAINVFIEDNKKPIGYKNREAINNALEGFRKDSVLILLSNKSLDIKQKELESVAKKRFDPKSTKHILLDILQCITLAFLVIMPVRVSQHKGAFFSTTSQQMEGAKHIINKFKESIKDERGSPNPDEVEPTNKKQKF